jgi:beta-aspartyl-peptidase (threonine type)
MEYKGLSLEEAARIVVNEKLVEQSGEGGLVAVDREGNVTMPFNSDGMYRGFMKSDGTSFIGIFRDELF